MNVSCIRCHQPFRFPDVGEWWSALDRSDYVVLVVAHEVDGIVVDFYGRGPGVSRSVPPFESFHQCGSWRLVREGTSGQATPSRVELQPPRPAGTLMQ